MNRASAALLLGASSMFANMYSTQAILPEIGWDVGRVGRRHRALDHGGGGGRGAGAWLHGPLSDRIGRWKVMVAVRRG